jgi:hypothetical protein
MPTAALLAWAGAAPGGEAIEPVAPSQRSDPCGFYRAQAFGRGLDHFSTEMLWACEAIVARRDADMALGERLAAVELALERYRLAVIAEGAAAFARSRSRVARSAVVTTADTSKAALAESTGALAALESVRAGY